MNIKEKLLIGTKDAIVHGRAGSGKSTLIRSLANEYDGNVLVLAPTGIAAENVGGRTLDSQLFPLRFGYKKMAKRLSLYDLIILDEISMIHNYKLRKLLDLVSFAENLSHKTIRVIMVGDVHQLPPVVSNFELKARRRQNRKENLSVDDFFFFQTPYFSMKLIAGEMDCYELTTSYRQQPDEKLFISLLEKIAYCQIKQEDLEIINSQVVTKELLDELQSIYLTTKRETAAEKNREKLREQKYISIAPTIKRYETSINPWTIHQAEKHNALNHIVQIGVGIPIIFTKNDSSGHFKNGNQGVITEIIKDECSKEMTIVGCKKNGESVLVKKITVPITINIYNKDQDSIIEKKVGEIEQYPFMTGYAFTIHKAQGLTLDSIILDTGDGCFAPGQLYVALSRVRRLEDLYLTQPIKISDLKPSEAIDKYLETFHSKAILA